MGLRLSVFVGSQTQLDTLDTSWVSEYSVKLDSEMHSKALLAALLAPAAVSAQLHDLAVRAGLKYFGTAVREGATSDAAYMAIVNNKSEFGSVVPENGQKWDATEPQRGSFTYANGDITANIAKRNGQLLRCHTLVWYSQLPSWGKYPGDGEKEMIAMEC